ncbi:MAG: hypothetical protein QXU88_01130 [Candidatus Woesearchaeota archaeon]
MGLDELVKKFVIDFKMPLEGGYLLIMREVSQTKSCMSYIFVAYNELQNKKVIHSDVYALFGKKMYLHQTDDDEKICQLSFVNIEEKRTIFPKRHKLIMPVVHVISHPILHLSWQIQNESELEFIEHLSSEYAVKVRIKYLHFV